MKNPILAFLPALLLLSLISSGCIFVSIGSSNTRHSSTEHVVFVPAFVYPVGQDDATVKAEIDAGAGLSFDSSKRKILSGIASRENLSADVQMYLVHTTYRCMGFDSDIRAVLLTLIDNPWFCNPAKNAVLEGLSNMKFDSDKEKILVALDRRGPLPLVQDPPPPTGPPTEQPEKTGNSAPVDKD